jgi:hypothetical protein
MKFLFLLKRSYNDKISCLKERKFLIHSTGKFNLIDFFFTDYIISFFPLFVLIKIELKLMKKIFNEFTDEYK